MTNPVLTPVSVSRDIGGHPMTIETGRMARQAAGTVTVRQGDTVVMCVVTTGAARPGIDFFPLTVDYRESTSAAGKFPGGFFKREGRPSTKEILTCRVMDRPIRPLFPDGFKDEVMISALVLSADNQHDPDTLSLVGASAALAISSIPWSGPLGGVRVGRVGDRLIINPTYAEREQGCLDLVVAATKDAITMVEAGADELPEEDMLDALFAGEEACQDIVALIEELVEKCGTVKSEFNAPEVDEKLKKKVWGFKKAYQKINFTEGKHNRGAAIKELRDEMLDSIVSKIKDEDEARAATKAAKELWDKLGKEVVREAILKDNRRCDDRGPEDIRPIEIEVGLLPRVHGSTLFTRGETQGLVSLTLGTFMDDQRVEGLMEPVRQKFMLHYNFPSYCVGETWPNRGPKRREIGHGNLAERALTAVVPDFESFPYTIRIRSDITESNGSSSMASVCGGTLALMDGGVPIRRPVAGIAMGLVSEGKKYVVLSDILGTEDACGDMDFKVAGTQNGITALQMDIKLEGLSREILVEALDQAREGRIHILRKMLKALKQPRPSISSFAPQILQVPIDSDKIGALIGPGGKTIRRLQEETKTKIEIDDENNIVTITSNPNAQDAQADVAEQMVRALASEVEVGTRFHGRVVSVRDFGCFVEVLPGLEGLVHVSELADGYVDNVSDVVSEGDEFEVEVIEVDAQSRIKLSKRKVDVEKNGGASSSEGGETSERPERSERNGGDRGGRGGDRGGRGDRSRSRGGDRGGRGGDRGGDRGGRGGDRGGDRGGRGGDRRRSRSRSSD